MSGRRIAAAAVVAAALGFGLGATVFAIFAATANTPPGKVTPVTAGPAVPRSLP